MNATEIEQMAMLEGEHWWYRGLRDMIARTLRTPGLSFSSGEPGRGGKREEGWRILDAGCGTGENLRFLRELLHPEYLGGFDISPRAVSLCREKIGAGADVYTSDIRDPEVRIDELDLILSCDVISMVGVKQAMPGLARLAARLRRGGLFILNVPAYHWLRGSHDVRVHTHERCSTGEVRVLLTDLGLAVELMTYRLCSLFPAVVMSRLPSMLFHPKEAEARSDLQRTAGWLNEMLSRVLSVENWAACRGRLDALGQFRLRRRPKVLRTMFERCRGIHDMELPAVFGGATVLVTGGLGFLGSNLAFRLVGCGAQVTLMDSLIEQYGGCLGNIREIQGRVAIDPSDMRDMRALESLVKGKDFIFHLAGQVSHGDSMQDPQLDLEVNCVSTMNLVEACRRHNPQARVLFTSTRQVYGRPQILPVTESHPAQPIDVNGINKLAAEYYHLLYHAVYGIRSTVLRLTNTYGPRQKISSDRQGVAAVFIRQALANQTIRLFGGGTQRRDFNYVDDVVEAMLLAISCDACHGHVFNVGSIQPCTLSDFARTLQALCRCKIESVPFPQDDKLIDIGDYYGDFSRLHEATGWKPAIVLEEGLRRTLAYHRQVSKENSNTKLTLV